MITENCCTYCTLSACRHTGEVKWPPSVKHSPWLHSNLFYRQNIICCVYKQCRQLAVGSKQMHLLQINICLCHDVQSRRRGIDHTHTKMHHDTCINVRSMISFLNCLLTFKKAALKAPCVTSACCCELCHSCEDKCYVSDSDSAGWFILFLPAFLTGTAQMCAWKGNAEAGQTRLRLFLAAVHERLHRSQNMASKTLI